MSRLPPDAGAMGAEVESPGLLAKTMRGAGWVIGWRMATRLLGVVSTLILVRLLQPADFGLASLAAAFAQSVDALAALGVEEAVMRERNADRDLYDTGFTISVLRGAATGTVIAILAVPAGWFFGDPRLAGILFVLAGSAVLEGFTNIGTVEFRRNFTFHKEFQFFLIPRMIAIVLVIAAAATFHSYWALVLGVVTQLGLRVVLSYVMHPYRPRLSLRAWRKLFGYSVWTWAVGVVTLIGERSDAMMIGRVLGPAAVGVYSLGTELAHLPTSELVEPLSRAAFPGFTAARHDGASANATYLRLVALMAMLTLPAGVGIALVAGPLVALAFGPAWTGATPLVQIIGVAGALTVFGRISSTLFSVHGMLPRMFSITAPAVCLRVVLLLVLVPLFGVLGAAVAATVAVLAEQVAYVVFTVRLFGLGLAELARRLWRSVFATACMAVAVPASGLTDTGGLFGLAVAANLAAAVALGAVVYGAALIGSWLAAGRPNGPERDALAALARIRLTRRARRT